MRLHPALARRIFFNRRNFLICLPLAACAKWQAPGAALPLLPPPPAGPYRLGPGDELTIRIYGQPDLSGPYSIDDSGYIDMPLLGLIAAAQQSNASLASTITNALKAQKLILHPSVAVEISRYRPFYILGEVNTPGPYPFRPGMTDLTAISIAGGFTYRAEQGYVGVTRVIGSTAAQYRAPLFALAQPGDVITVFERYY